MKKKKKTTKKVTDNNLLARCPEKDNKDLRVIEYIE